MTRKILIVLALIGLAAGLVFGIVHGYEGWRAHVYDEGDSAGASRVLLAWNKDKIARDAATAQLVAAARKDEQDKAAAAIQGEKDARDRAEKRAAAAAVAARSAAAAAGGMRDAIAALDASARRLGVPDAASCPGLFAQQRDEAIRARGLLGACSAEYRSLAADADGAVGDLELRLDTALSYVSATGAPGANEIPARTP